MILLPVAVRDGVVYGMNNRTGAIVPFTFSRASGATLFDSNLDMQMVTANLPRIDFGNYAKSVKLLVERESTNLIVDSALSLSGVYHSSVTLANINWFQALLSGRYIPHVDNVDVYAYKQCQVYKDISYKLSSFVMMEDGSMPVFYNSGNQYNGTLLFDSNPTIPAISELIKDNIHRVARNAVGSRDIIGNNGVVKFRNNYGGSILVSGYQLEIGNAATSYIPTSGSQATRAAETLSINLPQNTEVYLKTTKQEATLNKSPGTWNIHNDIENDGIEVLAIMKY